MPPTFCFFYNIDFLHLNPDKIIEDEIGVELNASNWVSRFVLDVLECDKTIVYQTYILAFYIKMQDLALPELLKNFFKDDLALFSNLSQHFQRLRIGQFDFRDAWA